MHAKEGSLIVSASLGDTSGIAVGGSRDPPMRWWQLVGRRGIGEDVALIHLDAQTMRKLGDDMLKPGGRQRRDIDAVPSARALVPTVQNAQELLVGSQPPNQSLIEELTNRLQLVDIRHDDLVRGIDGRLESEYWLSTSQETRDLITQVRLAVFATGRAIIQSAYIVEAGEVPFRAARVSAEHRRFLRTLITADGQTLEDKLDELQRVGTELGVIEKQREELGADGQLVVKERAARFAWIRAINALSAVLYAENVDPTTILGPIEKEAAKAERRAANKQSSQGGDGTGDDSTNSDTGESAGETDAPEDALDPPVPTDVVDTDDSES